MKPADCVLAGRSWFGRQGGEYPHRCKGRLSRFRTVPVCAGVLEEAGQMGGMDLLGKRYGVDWRAEAELAMARLDKTKRR